MAVINGKSQVTLNRQYLRFTPFEGTEYGGRYEGKDSYVLAAYNTLLLLGFEVEYVNDSSPISSVTFRFCGKVNNGVPVNPNLDFQDTWELVRNTVQKELLESDHPLVNALGASNLQILKNLINGTGPDVWTGDPTTTFNNQGTADYDAAVYLWAMHNAGERTVPVKQPVLRMSRTTNPMYTNSFNVNNVDTLLTTSSMLTDSGLPNSFAVPINALVTQLMAKTQLDGGGYQLRGDGLKLKFAWVKELVSSNKQGKKRIQYQLEYQFGLWDTKRYGEPS